MIRLGMYKLKQHLVFQACDIGYYGRGCQHECSIFCKISHDCNPVSGHCNRGCKNGWKGDECLESKVFFFIDYSYYTSLELLLIVIDYLFFKTINLTYTFFCKYFCHTYIFSMKSRYVK